MPRATAPTPWATPSQAAAIARASALKSRATGPGPLRTARGAGRAGARLVVARGLPRDAVDRVLPVLRDRVLELPLAALLLLPRDVFELRDPGGEDVRVAML
ncbi:hypothetical protein GCM10027026_05440 [Myroides odoratimimus subsp. xuanwuensis]